MSLSRGKSIDSEDVMISIDSPTVDDGASSGGTSCTRGGGGGVELKKGPWTSAEDAILVEYVKKHGEGNWNAVQKYSGLSRCGKSCRLRWANHLRPNLKKGAFTPEEERLIIELHAKMGNKWARMAAHMPGRTDNEIKNYWNTRIKRRQRAGLPLYPPELGMPAFQENQPYQDDDGLLGGDEGHTDTLQANGYDIASVMYGNLGSNQMFMPYIPPLPDFSSSSSLMKSLGSPQIYSFMPPTSSCRKRLREPQQHLSSYDGHMANEGPQFDRDQDDNSTNKGSQYSSMCFPYDPDATSKKVLPIGANQGCQSLLIGNLSASKPVLGAVKLELPSLQYPEPTLDSWFSNPFLPALESVDSFIVSSPLEPTQSDCPSPRSSGLLEALVHEAKALSGSKNPSSEKSSNSSTVTPADVTDCSPLTMCATEYESYGNPNSPFGNSSGSIFSNCTPISATRSSLEENPSAEFFSGIHVKSEPIDHTWNLEGERNESSSQLKFLRPDALLGSCWLAQSASCADGRGMATDAMADLLGDDLSSEFKSVASGSGNGPELDSFSWKNMPPVCQMPELA